MITPLTMDEKIPRPPPKEALARDAAPPEYSSVFASSTVASRGAAAPSAFDAAMFTPDVLRRASGSSEHTMPPSPRRPTAHTRTYPTRLSSSSSSTSLSRTPPASTTLSPSSSRTSASSSPSPPPRHPHSKSQPHLPSAKLHRHKHKKERSSGAKVVRAVSTGLCAIVLTPIAVGGVAVVATGAALYGSGKLVEGIGRGIAVGPEMAWKAYRAGRGRSRKVSRGFGSGKGEADEQVVEAGVQPRRSASVPARRSRSRDEAGAK